MKTSSRWTTFFVILARLGVLLMLATCAVIWLTGDRWWGSFALLFGPRWVASGILLLPIPLLLHQPRRGWAPMLIAGLLLVVGIMGWRVGPARIIPQPAPTFRLASYNMASSGPIQDRFLAHLDSLAVDVAIGVECGKPKAASIPDGWQVRHEGELCLFSKHPIVTWKPFPESTSLARATVRVGERLIDIGLLHLTSPRDALTRFLDMTQTESTELERVVDQNSAARRRKAIRADAYFGLEDERPLVIGGDFNLPPESTLFWGFFGDFTDAFERAGLGFGYTWRSRWHGLRIDHIMTRGRVVAVRTWVGPDFGSDHLPVIADLTVFP